ncbi:MAG TPA: hypothetical protein VMS18_28520 [Candidatus Binatia bacterium]|nr:hypothetical protein [Candidatus Binatia bacterium]
MTGMVEWIAAQAEDLGGSIGSGISLRGRFGHQRIADLTADSFSRRNKIATEDTPRLHSGQAEEDEGGQDPQVWQNRPEVGHPEDSVGALAPELTWEEERERRIYRGRTINMLRKYMRYSIDTGRLPSVLGREFFRARVSARSAVTFEDRVIFVHDMETSLNKLDEFSRELIARHILQEHDQEATARLLHCAERTVRTYVPMALDLLSEILLDVGLLERTFPIREKLCQGGGSDENSVSDCEVSKNKFQNFAG